MFKVKWPNVYRQRNHCPTFWNQLCCMVYSSVVLTYILRSKLYLFSHFHIGCLRANLFQRRWVLKEDHQITEVKSFSRYRFFFLLVYMMLIVDVCVLFVSYLFLVFISRSHIFILTSYTNSHSFLLYYLL